MGASMASPKQIVIIGAGPSGLMAAEILAQHGHRVRVYDRMPSPGRKLLIAGRGGLNLTHSEPLETFLTRYGSAKNWLAPSIRAFTPDDLRQWCEGLGQETFIGSSGRVFPKSMKASGLLRAWLKRLEGLGVEYLPRHTWHGWLGPVLHFTAPSGTGLHITADATLLALGGASWPKLGSDGSWVQALTDIGVEVAPLRAANCGFMVNWSPYMRERFAGEPLKPVRITHEGASHQAEAMITNTGIEGGAVYGLSSSIREAITEHGTTIIHLDLRPTLTLDALAQKLQGRGSRSLSSHLAKAGFSPLATALLHETIPRDQIANASAHDLAGWLKALPLTLTGATDMARAISSAGGITHDSVNEHFMLIRKPGVFVAGEMLDWEAPTGGYLLQACFSTAVAAAHAIMQYLQSK